MNLKTLFQILIISTLLLISFLFYYIYFHKTENVVNIKKEVKIEAKNLTNNSSDKENFLKDVRYKSTDKKNNQYIIEAKIGEIKKNNPNILMLENVTGIVIMSDNVELKIYSNFAEYNSLTLDTKFFDNVKIDYVDNKLTSNNVDLTISNNLVKIYNNVKFQNKNLKSMGDQIKYDIVSGNVVIDMFEDINKVKFSKINGSN